MRNAIIIDVDFWLDWIPRFRTVDSSVQAEELDIFMVSLTILLKKTWLKSLRIISISLKFQHTRPSWRCHSHAAARLKQRTRCHSFINSKEWREIKRVTCQRVIGDIQSRVKIIVILHTLKILFFCPSVVEALINNGSLHNKKIYSGESLSKDR